MIHRPLCVAIEKMSSAHIEKGSDSNPLAFVPEPFQLLARLGSNSAPLVSFNVERLSSGSVAGLASCCAYRPYLPNVPQSPNRRVSAGSFRAGSTARLIYHPHGLIDMSGLCVLAASDYQSQQATLAFQLAIHAAFQSDLYIVGMSLDDDYLRTHLAAFRSQIKRVYWFTPFDLASTADLERWCWTSRVEVVKVATDWSDFWHEIRTHAPQIESGKVRTVGQSWFQVCNLAYREFANGGNFVGPRIRFDDAEIDNELDERDAFFAELHGEQAVIEADALRYKACQYRFDLAYMKWFMRKDVAK